jgi:N utilization substance protein B
LGKRRKARIFSIQILYQLGMNKSDTDSALKTFWEDTKHCEEIQEFTTQLVKGTTLYAEKIDEIIVNTAKNWPLHRISPIDRAILRQAIFELMYCPEIPSKVTLNEAIELGKKFGSEKSGFFINGILDNVLNNSLKQKEKAGRKRGVSTKAP